MCNGPQQFPLRLDHLAAVTLCFFAVLSVFRLQPRYFLYDITHREQRRSVGDLNTLTHLNVLFGSGFCNGVFV